MSDPADTGRAARFRLRTTAAALSLVAVMALVACESGSKSIGVGGGLSADASLSALQVSSGTGGTFTPAFDSATTVYSGSTFLATITVTPTATNRGATITVSGVVIASGSASAAIAVDFGLGTTIDVVVTAADGTTRRKYTLRVVRMVV